jgi:hypothetical protein
VPAGRNRQILLAVVFFAVGGALTLSLLRASSPAVAVNDSTATRPAAAPQSAASIAGPTWNIANREWLANPRKGVAFELRSVNKVAVWNAQAQPTLVVRCELNRLVTFVYTESQMQMEAQDENHTVRIRFDDEPEITERWADSSDHDALFAPDGVAFARRLMGARVLRFGFSPHNAPRALAEFHVSGLRELIEPAARQCGWTK